jgi:hypothetical protein
MLRISDQLLDGSRGAGELATALGVERSTLTRAYRRESEHLLRLGRARATRYALRHTYAGLEASGFPVFRVDETGIIARAGQLVTLAGSESVWLPDETIIDGLPPEFQDIAPMGFLGHSFARRHLDLALPDNVSQWSDHHVLIALTRRGEDQPGNLVIGRESFDRWQALNYHEYTSDDFPELAEATLAGEYFGSSAGGEQPKFSVFLEGQHKLVKFANNRSSNARRWQDLLTLELVALETLRDAGVPAAQATLHNVGDYRCLAVDRFDRSGRTGRRAVMTLSAVTSQAGISWAQAANQLQAEGLMHAEDTQRIALLDAFGAQIANTDRHLFNVLLYPTEYGYALAPVFDQLPMAYAPPASGNLRTAAIDPVKPTVDTFDVWEEASFLAAEYWQRAAKLQLSDSMTAIVASHVKR